MHISTLFNFCLITPAPLDKIRNFSHSLHYFLLITCFAPWKLGIKTALMPPLGCSSFHSTQSLVVPENNSSRIPPGMGLRHDDGLQNCGTHPPSPRLRWTSTYTADAKVL